LAAKAKQQKQTLSNESVTSTVSHLLSVKPWLQTDSP